MKSVANVDFSGTVFDDVRTKVNDLAYIVTTETITCNSTLAQSNGNADLRGKFSANVLAANATIRGGNATSNAALGISGDGYMVGARSFVTVGRVATTNADPSQILDSFLMSGYGAANYLLHCITSSNCHYVSQLNLVHDGTTPLMTEFGQLGSNGSVGSFTANANSTAVQILFSPAVAVNNVTFRRELLVL